jgi:hypothetical protein
MSINHRAEAERHASKAAHVLSDTKAHPIDPIATDFHLRMAQVHATLAAGEARAADLASLRHAIHTYRFALVRQVAEGLIYSLTDEAHQHALGLSKYLDSVDLNIDREVDAYVEEHVGSGYMKDAYEAPSVRHAKRLKDSPWATTTTRDSGSPDEPF